jgi:chemotaxis protein methyltransferase CheR
VLLEARLAKRLRALGLVTFGAYYNHLRRGDLSGEERTRFVNAVTTNETAFFRETAHFTHLEAEWLPARRALADAGGRAGSAPGAPRAAPARSPTRSR